MQESFDFEQYQIPVGFKMFTNPLIMGFDVTPKEWRILFRNRGTGKISIYYGNDQLITFISVPEDIYLTGGLTLDLFETGVVRFTLNDEHFDYVIPSS